MAGRDGSRRMRQRNVVGGRSHRHAVWLSDEQEVAVRRLAEVQGKSVPRVLVESALSGESRGVRVAQVEQVVSELMQIHRLVGSVSNNVNQIARKMHMGDGVDVQALRFWDERCMGLCDRMDAVMDELMGLLG